MGVFDQGRAERLHEQAAEAFSRHQIRRQGDGRWLIQRKYDDDNGWSSTFATEVISLYGGELYVGGDIDFVIFGYYSDTSSHTDKLDWMGRCNDFGWYINQKATIGTGRKLIEVYDDDAARDYVRQWLADEREAEQAEDREASLSLQLDDLLSNDHGRVHSRVPWEDRHQLIEHLHDELGYDVMSERYDIGMVIAPRVYYAYAALRKLCDLLDEQQELRKKENQRRDRQDGSLKLGA